ncbi:hypothetical protein Pint_06363 [Pistacia integerrima]|uniref:Uncharacterized protein n=1 Tax=Pistacia integerrima TaxID=434235 RepID=A0ACC0Z3D3_9ROSI|nr:hypothetical protein Pint_06363 [Pistacia integerrima]
MKSITRPENYLGNLTTWEKAEAALTEALTQFGKPWQLDFHVPDRFNLGYSAEDEAKMERPVMIHRAILGNGPFGSIPVKQLFALSRRNRSHMRYSCGIKFSKRVTMLTYDMGSSRCAVQLLYILVVGEQEAKTGKVVSIILPELSFDRSHQLQVSVRERDRRNFSVMSIESLLSLFNDKTEAYINNHILIYQ